MTVTTTTRHPQVATATAARAEGLSKFYGVGDAAVAALDNVSVGLAAGQFTAIMGPSGSGKSTLLHVLAGLDRPTLGPGLPRRHRDHLAQRQGADAAAPRPDRLHLPVVQPAPDDDRGREHRASDAHRRPQAGRALGRLDRRDRRPHWPALAPPGAAVRRPAAARRRGPRAGLASPQIVFADEPTGALDSGRAPSCSAFLRNAVTELGQTVVMVTHDPSPRLRRPRPVPRRRPDRRRDARPNGRQRPRLHEAPGSLSHVDHHHSRMFAHKLRLALTTASIALGVAFLAGTLS